jgi:cysteine synthase
MHSGLISLEMMYDLMPNTLTIIQGNFRAHYLHTGVEILEQTEGRKRIVAIIECHDVLGKVDLFCDFVGSGGTFGGIAAR